MDQLAGEKERQQADGNIDEEDPAPTVVIRNPTAEHRPDRRGRYQHNGVESEGRSTLGRRKGIHQNGLRYGGEASTGDALEDAADQHYLQGGRDAAEKRHGCEENYARQIVVFASKGPAQPGAHGQDHCIRDQVGGQDPRHFIVAATEATADIRERNIGDRSVEQLHEGGNRNRHGDNPRVDRGPCRRQVFRYLDLGSH